MIQKQKSEQARAEVLKTVRSLVRLKYSLMADRELNDVLPKADAKFTEMAHRGVLPSTTEIRKALGI